MNPNKALWEKGDFTRIAATMRESGEARVDSFGVTKGLKVLDLGCGDGTTALPAAALGMRLAWTSRKISSRPATGARASMGLPTARSRKATPRTSRSCTE